MGRYATAAAQPLTEMDEGDDKFVGWNCKLVKSDLPPGYFSDSNNKRVIDGKASRRAGTLTPVFANILAFTAILGSGQFSNPFGVEVMLVATPTQVLVIRAGYYPQTVSIPNGVTLSGPIEFSQQFSVVLLHAPSLPATLVWDGTVDNGFVPVTKSNPANPITSVIPNVAWSVNVGDRAWIPYSSSVIAASDDLDYTTFDLTLTGNKFPTTSGASDPITGAYPYAQNNLIIGKRNSINVLTNVDGDLSATSMEVLSSTVGILARRSCKMVGGDLLFLHDTGVYQVSQVIQDRLEASPVPVSDSIAPFLRDRINWPYASNAVAAVFGPYYYLAVPIDGSTVNNAVLVYNTATQAWETYDTWNSAAGFQIDNLMVTDFFGRKALYAVNQAGSGSVHILYEGAMDELAYDRVGLGHTVYEVADAFETRGYARIANLGYLFDVRGAAELGPGEKTPSTKAWDRAEIVVRTWRPSMSVYEITDKAGDQRLLTPTPITKSNTKYDIWAKPDYVVDNSNNDWETPGRQDYSVDETQGTYEGPTGVDGERKQTEPLRFSVSSRARYVSYRIVNTQGICDIMRVLAESRGSPIQTMRAA